MKKEFYNSLSDDMKYNDSQFLEHDQGIDKPEFLMLVGFG